MKKFLYIVLLIGTIASMFYTYDYAVKHPQTVSIESQIATTTIVTESSDNHFEKTLTTKTGKQISVKESNPQGASLSTITISTTGFATNTSFQIEKNKLTNVFLLDIDDDSYDELAVVTTSQSSGSYGEVLLYTTESDAGLSPVPGKDLSEDDTKTGGTFEGYMGHDIFEVKNNTLTRTFPLYTKNDTNISPTGGKAVLVYSLKKEKGAYSIIYSRTVAPPDQSGSSTTSEITSLSGTSWVWNIPKNKITPPTPKQEKAFVLSFGKDNTVTSTTDCNSMTGTYAASGTSLLFGTFAATLMYCEGSQEGAYSESLSKVRLYKVEAETLTLSLTNDELMTFKRK